MSNKIKNLVLIILIILVVVCIGFMLVQAIRSISYNENAQNPVVTLNIEEYGEVQIELYPDYAPNTVTNIINLVQKGFYDGKLFYGTDGIAVNAGMILEEEEEEETEETTDEITETEEETTEEVTEETTTDEEEEEEEEITPEEDTLMASYYDSSIEADSDDDYEIAIEGEFVANGYNDNTLRFEYGTVGLYRNDYEGYGTDLSSYSYNSGTSLFFILTEEDSSLNGMYAAFGKVISGMDIIEQINELPVTEDEDSTEGAIEYFETYPVITSATVETYGVDYGTPDYIEAFDYYSFMSDLLLQSFSTN